MYITLKTKHLHFPVGQTIWIAPELGRQFVRQGKAVAYESPQAPDGLNPSEALIDEFHEHRGNHTEEEEEETTPEEEHQEAKIPRRKNIK
jgi:hypothetical protein